ncbi:MAG: right-handed parallel beta-helix repeat-containing protein [Rubripirellula sp.]
MLFVGEAGFRRLVIAGVFSVGLLLQASFCHAAQYYVGTNGSDGRNKSQAQSRSTPWRSIRHAMSQISGGDDVVVLNGTYYEGVSINRSGYAGNETVLRAENKRGAKVVGFISCYDKSYVKVDGFDVRNPSSSGQTKGIAFGRCHHVTVRSCHVHDCWGGGITVDKSDWILIEWNKTNNNAYYNPSQHSGISVYQPQYRASDSRKYGIIIRNNTSFANWNRVNNSQFGRPTDGNGIVVDDFYNSQSGGNGVAYDRLTVIENNLCYDNGGQGIHCFKAQNVRVRNNTCVNNMGSFDFGGEVTASNSNRIFVYNNILVARPGKNAALQFASTNYWFGYNIINGPTRDVPFSSSNRYESPRFNSGTYVPSSSSPAINSGYNGSDHFFMDIYGRGRFNGQIDRGAHERQ